MTAPSPAGQTPADRSEADLIERVARAMHKADPHAWTCGWPCPAAATFYRRMAAAAVEVLRGETR